MSPQSRAQRILVVEDDPDTAELIRFALEEQGYEVLITSSAPQAEEEWGRFSPHLVITDYMMPGITGMEFVHYLRDRVLVPIIVYTAYPSDSLVKEAAGRFAEVVPKGSLHGLLEAVETHLKG